MKHFGFRKTAEDRSAASQRACVKARHRAEKVSDEEVLGAAAQEPRGAIEGHQRDAHDAVEGREGHEDDLRLRLLLPAPSLLRPARCSSSSSSYRSYSSGIALLRGDWHTRWRHLAASGVKMPLSSGLNDAVTVVGSDLRIDARFRPFFASSAPASEGNLSSNDASPSERLDLPLRRLLLLAHAAADE